jgi:hypothetical protein
MPKTINDDELIRLTSKSEEVSHRLCELRVGKWEHKAALKELEETHLQKVREVYELTGRLNDATQELRKMASERTDRTGELRDLAMEIKETAKQWRDLRRAIQDRVGRDVCPKCGSSEIATIMYGLPLPEAEDDLYEPDCVMGGCCVERDETVCCLDCGNRFLGNFEKWERARAASAEPETVLKIGAEGGTLAVVRRGNQDGAWDYWCLRDETIMLELLPEGELGSRDELYENSARLSSFEDALIRLDKYPWFSLYPMKVSAEFAEEVLEEVEKRGGKEAAAEWAKRLRDHHFDD